MTALEQLLWKEPKKLNNPEEEIAQAGTQAMNKVCMLICCSGGGGYHPVPPCGAGCR